MANIYSEIRPDLRYIADYLEDNEVEYRAYNHGVQYNAVGKDGGIHSFYPTTGTIVLHAPGQNNRQNKTFRNANKEKFLYFVKHPEGVEKYFK